MKRALLGILAGALILPLASARVGAQAPPLTFFTNYFLTGDYEVGGASLWRRGVNGRATAAITVPDVPVGVDIVGAFLYLQTAERVQWSGIDHATFNGYDLGPGSNSIAKALNWEQATRPCWSVAFPGGRRLVTYRADVLRFLPIAESGAGAGKFDLSGPLAVTVPDYGYAFDDDDELGIENPAITGPRAIGASLVVVYRDPSKPYRGIVVYDGGFTKHAFSTMTQSLGGFYQASATPDARLTAIVGDGRPFLSERVRVNGALVATNPFASTAGPKWDNPTFALPQVTQNAAGVAVEITPNGLLSDCLSASAFVLGVNVQDTDGDGLLDVWETAGANGAGVLYDPLNQPLPPLGAMGAHPQVKDLFIELGAMFTTAENTYGDTAKPAHSHLPGLEALQLMGDAFANAPVSAPGGSGIRVHFDVGDAYPLGSVAQEQYIIRDDPGLPQFDLARGGELLDEQVTVCAPAEGDPPYVCQFSQHPGTVGWKSGYRFLRDHVTHVNGAPAPSDFDETLCGTTGYACTRRFDPNRQQSFHYALFAHALGLPQEEDPNHPGFHVPRTNTGIGDFPGADVLITLGGFADAAGLPIGTPFMQASTLMHELGHNLERRHGGEPFEQNCKPTYFSVMNYLYQLRGLLDNDGKQHLDFARGNPFGATVDESALPTLSVQPYRMGWYAPLIGSYLEDAYPPVGTSKLPTRFCNGAEFPGGVPPEVMHVRVDASKAEEIVDWAADGDPTNDPVVGQDVNFNGRIDGAAGVPALPPLPSSDDWSAVMLNQVGVRRNIGALYPLPGTLLDFVGPLSVNLGKGDLGKGDLGKGDLGKGDLGKGDLGKGDLGKGDLGKGDLGKGDLGKGDLGKGDLGGGDLFDGDPNNPGGELDVETFTSMGSDPAYELTACIVGENCVPPPELQLHDVLLSWTAASGEVSNYAVYRVPGTIIPDEALWGEPLDLVDPGLQQFADTTSLVNGATYTYFVVVNYVNLPTSAPSNPVTITAVNDPPAAEPDDYEVAEDGELEIAAPGVLGNDSDDDEDGLTAALVAASGPVHGDLTLHPDGSFEYTPDADFHGADTFQYVARSGEIDSAPATVTITVNPVNDPPSPLGDAYSTPEDTPLTRSAAEGVLANDGDVDGDTLTAFLYGPAPAGLLFSPDGSFTYTPAADFAGEVTFKYTVHDGTVMSAPITVTITVNPVNDPPVAHAQAVTANEDTAKAIVLTGTDPEGTALAFSVVTGPAYGVLSGTAPNLTYTPAANYHGPDAFTFRVFDGGLYSDPATVAITVTAINDAPVAVDDGYSTNQGVPLTVAAPGVLGNDTDVETAAAALTAALASQPASGKGTVVLNADGSFTYTPPASFSGVATFTYSTSDGVASSSTATVTITVNAVGYGFVNVKNLPPAAGVTFKPSSKGTMVDFEWKFTSNGSPVASSDARPRVTIQFPNGTIQTFTPENCAPVGIKFEYKSDGKLWDFHWKPKNNPTGTYYVVVYSDKTGQRFPASGGFPVVFKN